MKKYLLGLLALFLVGCDSGLDIKESIINPLDNTDKIIHVSNTGTFDYELSNLSNSDVYFVFTNTNTASSESSSTVTSLSKLNNITKNSVSNATSDSTAEGEKGQMGKAYISKFNGNPFKSGTPTKSKVSKSSISKSSSYSLAQNSNFYDDIGRTVPATLRKIVLDSNSGKNLYVWVEDNSWTGSNIKKHEVTQDMVDVLADKFLKSGTNNDIYDWVTNIIGEPWGTQPYEELIGDTDDIHILISDIDNDDSDDGGVVGYFYGRDNFTNSVEAYSNEKIMFTIDSVMLATESDTSWDITDYWPEFVVSTLAHEFQHMIMFYQKGILTDFYGVDAWIDEMSSQCIEDLVAQKILADGPRGVNYDDGTSGSLGNTKGRLPLYNFSNRKSVVDWNYNDSLPNYSVSYAFGAYLIRNYGGANFIKSLVQSDKTSYDAVEQALTENGYSITFGKILQNFGVANLLSDRTDNINNYKFNTGNWFSSSIDGITYNFGSINLYNYEYNGLAGPYIYTTLPSTFDKASNTYYKAGENLTGTYKWHFDNLDSDVKVTIVIK